MGGSCVAAVHKAGCTSGHGVAATSPKNPSAVDLVKPPPPTIVPSLLLRTVAHDGVARSLAQVRDGPRISSYADIYARTGRLLI